MSSQLRILLVNQTGQMSGAEHSLMELLRGLPSHVDATVACPRGDLFNAVSDLGLRTYSIPPTDVSFRLHPIHTTAGVAWAARAGLQLRRIARETDADLIYGNTTRAGLAAAFAARSGGPPAIVHIRDWVPSGWLSTAVLRTLDVGATAVITNSSFIASELPPPPLSPVHVIHDPVDTDQFDPSRFDRAAARREFDFDDDELVLAVIAQLTPWKGQDDAIRILAGLKRDDRRVRLVVGGSAKFTAASARFDNAAYERKLHQMARELGVEQETTFLGQCNDVPKLLRATDVLLVPSWKEAFGRIALEGMAMEVPVAAANAGGPAEIVRGGVDGLLLPPRRPDAWVSALDDLLDLPDRRRAMGCLGRLRATQEFTIEGHLDRLLSVFEDVTRGEAKKSMAPSITTA